MATVNTIQDILNNPEDLRAFRALSPEEQTSTIDFLNPLVEQADDETRQELLQFMRAEAPETLSIGEMFKQAGQNLIPSGVRVMEDIFQAVNDPVTTFDTLSSIALGAIGREFGVEDAGRDSEAIKETSEFFKERFGGFENIKRTVADDPAGVLTELSTIASGAGPFLKAGGVASRIARAATLGDPIALAGETVSRTANALLPKASTSLIKTAIKPSSVLNPKLTEAQKLSRSNVLANEFIDRGLKFNEASIDSLRKGIDEVQGDISNVIARGTLQGKTIRTADVVSSIDDIIDDLDSLGIETPDITKSKNVLNRFRDDTLAASPETLTPAQAQNFKKLLNRKFLPNATQGAAAIRTVALDKLRSTTKTLLEDQFPQLKELNANQGVMIELDKAITKRLRTLEEQPFIGSSGLQSGAVGGALGAIVSGQAGGTMSEIALKATGFGVGAFAAEKIFKSPSVQIKIAKALNFANQQLAKTGRLNVITQPSFQAGRLQEEIESR